MSTPVSGFDSVNTSIDPSGVHERGSMLNVPSRASSRSTKPAPSALISNSAAPPSRFDSKTTALPSGVQRGFESGAGSVVRRLSVSRARS